MEEDSVPIPSSWKVQTIYEVIEPSRSLCYGVVQPGEEVQGGAILIRVQDIDRWGILTNNLRTVSSAIDAEYRRSRVRSGDLLVSVVGTIGRTAIVPDGIEANIARAVARVACREGVSSIWVNYWLSSDPLQWWLSRSSREVARKTLNLSELGATQVAVPPKEEQAEIIRRAESLFAYANALEARYTAARAQVDRLTPALLAKAFRGELVPQDPNDEPAEALLTRLGVAQGDSSLESLKTHRDPGRPRKISKTEVSMLNRKDISRAHLSAILIMRGPLTAESLWLASQLEIDDFYDQLKAEEALELLREMQASDGKRQLEAVE
jgi:type I restriction enzyme S subunit